MEESSFVNETHLLTPKSLVYSSRLVKKNLGVANSDSGSSWGRGKFLEPFWSREAKRVGTGNLWHSQTTDQANPLKSMASQDRLDSDRSNPSAGAELEQGVRGSSVGQCVPEDGFLSHSLSPEFLERVRQKPAISQGLCSACCLHFRAASANMLTEAE